MYMSSHALFIYGMHGVCRSSCGCDPYISTVAPAGTSELWDELVMTRRHTAARHQSG